MAKKPEPTTPPAATENETPAPADVRPHRQCPICFGTTRGVGRAYATRGNTRYYKCAVCGHTWTVQLPVGPDLQHRDGEPPPDEL